LGRSAVGTIVEPLTGQRPRKTLGRKTPAEAMVEDLAVIRSNGALDT